MRPRAELDDAAGAAERAVIGTSRIGESIAVERTAKINGDRITARVLQEDISGPAQPGEVKLSKVPDAAQSGAATHAGVELQTIGNGIVGDHAIIEGIGVAQEDGGIVIISQGARSDGGCAAGQDSQAKDVEAK